MDDPLVVGLLERLGDLPGDHDGLVDRQRPALQALREVLALGQLHDEEVGLRAVVEGHALEPVQVRDAGVVEGGQDLRLPLEAGEPVGVGGEGRGEELQRDVAPEPRVGRAPHLAHAPGAEGGEDLVGSQSTAGGEGQCARDSR